MAQRAGEGQLTSEGFQPGGCLDRTPPHHCGVIFLKNQSITPQKPINHFLSPQGGVGHSGHSRQKGAPRRQPVGSINIHLDCETRQPADAGPALGVISEPGGKKKASAAGSRASSDGVRRWVA